MAKTKNIGVEWSRIADRLRSLRPDTGNRYAPRSVKTKGAAKFELWQETCRTFAYEVCVVQKIVSEIRFYEACGYEVRELPIDCAREMGCLCAGHARGNPAAAPCDTTESR